MVMATKAAEKAMGKKKPSWKLNPCRVGTAQCIGVPVAINTIAVKLSSAKREGYSIGNRFPLRLRYVRDFLNKKNEQMQASKAVITIQLEFGSKTGAGK